MRRSRHTLVFLTGLCLLAGTQAALCAASGPYLAGLRRLTESQYRNSIADIFGPDILVQGKFEPDSRVGGLLSASSSILSITPAGFEGYAKIADGVAKQVVDEKHRAKLLPCAPKSPDAADRGCASQIFTKYGLQLFRRPLTADELKTRLDAADAVTKQSGNFYTGIRYSLTTLLSAPDFLFRAEVAVPAGKAYTLDGYSRAARLSYMLWDTTPDEGLLNAARTGALDTDAGVKTEVARLMASPRLETGMRSLLQRFPAAGYAWQITKDPTIYPKYSDEVAASAREETLRTSMNLTLKNNGDFRELFTTHKTFINRSLAWIYDVPYNLDGDWMPYEFHDGDAAAAALSPRSRAEHVLPSRPQLADQARRGADGHLPVPADADPAGQCGFFHRQRHQQPQASHRARAADGACHHAHLCLLPHP